MNKIAGNITFKGNIDINHLGFDFIITKVKDLISNIFIYGNTQMGSSEEVLGMIGSRISGEILNYDISISSEDNIKVFEVFQKGKYVVKSIQGENIDFDTIIDSINEPGIVSVREAEISKIFGNRIIKIDLIV